MTTRDCETFSVAGERDDEAGEVKTCLSSQGFGGDVLKSLFHPKRRLQRYLRLSLVQNGFEGNNGNRNQLDDYGRCPAEMDGWI